MGCWPSTFCTQCTDGRADPRSRWRISIPSLPNVSCRYFPCLCTQHITRTAAVFLSHSICAGVSIPASVYVLSLDVQQSAEDPTFTNESRFTRAGISNTQREHVWSDENAHAIRSRWLPHTPSHFTGTRWWPLLLLIPFEHTLVGYWEMCPSIRVLTCGFFNTTVLHHITAVKCVSGFRKLSWTLDWSWTWRSNFPDCTLTWLESSEFFLWG
jgi:hypothetical protein